MCLLLTYLHSYGVTGTEREREVMAVGKNGVSEVVGAVHYAMKA